MLVPCSAALCWLYGPASAKEPPYLPLKKNSGTPLTSTPSSTRTSRVTELTWLSAQPSQAVNYSYLL